MDYKSEKFARDVTNICHYVTGNLSITIKDNNNFEKAKLSILESYNNNYINSDIDVCTLCYV